MVSMQDRFGDGDRIVVIPAESLEESAALLVHSLYGPTVKTNLPLERNVTFANKVFGLFIY